ncbi:zinc-dependent alcohol dehydrogenase family protein [Rubinisphaera margarita]|uniref:zinc-dependent alcohol dehydrogenase family protein n=1 Tax=Rubinisphaera margarita TaxID=2909586 RepID=UPI001EE7AA74|nr:zinc-dependent alcohol dehydrogenase family protein [Rubinisphaera margarita]MCG6156980.1 zinc-dependent alcohol dehydrogenase family protein [Rubinisphaera margarita]
MKALLYRQFQQAPAVERVSDPDCPPDGAVIKVEATGLCRSDWHGWMGHDDCIALPHVPGHEFAGTVLEVGSSVKRFRPGIRATAPFVCGCGSCEYCRQGNQQVCPQQTQPGFTHWGSFAEFVVVHQADENLVELPEETSFLEAASLGCRFATAFRAIVDQARLQPGETIAIFGCGGVGLSAIMIARACGARVIAVDRSQPALQSARNLEAEHLIDAAVIDDVPAAIRELTHGGAHVSVDALGHSVTFRNSVASLRKRGRHLQIGLLLAEHADPRLPMGRVIADELQLFGCHGMQAHRYPAMLELVQREKIPLRSLIRQTISLSEASEALAAMSHASPVGITLIDRF